MATKKPTAAEVTPDLIKQWKGEHGRVVKYKTADGKVAYFKEPDITAIDASAALAKTNPIKSNIALAKACFIGGDEEVITEKEYVLGLGNHLSQLVTKVEGELSEL